MENLHQLYQQRNDIETQLSQRHVERELILKQLISKQEEIDAFEYQHNQMTKAISDYEQEQWGETSEMSIDSQIPFERRRQRKILIQREIKHLKDIRNRKWQEIDRVLIPSSKIIDPLVTKTRDEALELQRKIDALYDQIAKIYLPNDENPYYGM